MKTFAGIFVINFAYAVFIVAVTTISIVSFCHERARAKSSRP